MHYLLLDFNKTHNIGWRIANDGLILISGGLGLSNEEIWIKS